MLRVYLVSPWLISHESEEFGPLARILSSIRTSGARLSVLTRTPEKVSHQRAVDLCIDIPTSEVLYLDALHAKLYLCEARGLRAAFIGSPNFTPHGDRIHRELAVEIRSIKETDPGALLVEDLFLFARELMTDRSATFRKRLGDVGRPSSR